MTIQTPVWFQNCTADIRTVDFYDCPLESLNLLPTKSFYDEEKGIWSWTIPRHKEISFDELRDSVMFRHLKPEQLSVEKICHRLKNLYVELSQKFLYEEQLDFIRDTIKFLENDKK